MENKKLQLQIAAIERVEVSKTMKEFAADFIQEASDLDVHILVNTNSLEVTGVYFGPTSTNNKLKEVLMILDTRHKEFMNSGIAVEELVSLGLLIESFFKALEYRFNKKVNTVN